MTAGYPQAHRDALTEIIHGLTISDPYRWLEDAASARTEAWSRAQDALFIRARTAWSDYGPLRTRIAELSATGAVDPPVWRGERAFFTRRLPDQEHAVLVTVDAAGTERVLVDPVRLNPDGTTTLDGWYPSPSGLLVAYQVSEGGTEESVTRVLNSVTGEDVDGPIDRTRYTDVSWLADESGYYYTRRLAPELVPPHETQYHRRVYLHRVGTDPADDPLIFGEGLKLTRYHHASVSADGRWLQVSSSEGTEPNNDLYLADLSGADPAAPPFKPVQTGVAATTYLYPARGDSPLAGRALVFTTLNAPRGRICVTSTDDPAPEAWRELIPEDAEAVIEDLALVDGPELQRPLLLVVRIRHATCEITVHDAVSGEQHGTVPLPSVGTVAALTTRRTGGHEAWFSYTDFGTPPRVYRYDARTGATTLWADTPGKPTSPKVHTQQVEYASKDGTVVRMFIVSGEPNEVPGQPRPALLYGYGGFNVSLPPEYTVSALTWVEAGGVYAVANLRGGGEEGEQWHRAGTFADKQNVFDDFHAAAQYLIDRGWTTPDQLAIHGGSNGGLLVGAALTQHPERYRAVACSAPLLDMVRYELFGLGETWNVEYGSADDPQQLAALFAYSPVHNVHEHTQYPAVLFTVFEGDTRVDPLHARKLCAALQWATSGDPADRPVLLRRETGVGHGARAVSRRVDLLADTLAFLAHHTGLRFG
ncbi:S9 family peptidase [Actinocrinis puniceicyclus]|uniref:prolyl oligopeptidase n=1 Tax=Actinocrinis puniceicyclus TaxID=977794 RepID=A0A8J7WJU1_9ACTN|nr:S9 family peptidase [Actinocrinis puniceicyclus]